MHRLRRVAVMYVDEVPQPSVTLNAVNEFLALSIIYNTATHEIRRAQPRTAAVHSQVDLTLLAISDKKLPYDDLDVRVEATL